MIHERNEAGQPDAITFLMDEHRRVDRLFTQYGYAAGGGDVGLKSRLVDQMIEELGTHATMEELTFYPSVREVIADGEALVAEAIEEHAAARERLDALQSMAPQDPGFDPMVQSLIAEVRHHVNEEETELLSRLRQAVGETWLFELGRELEATKARILSGAGAPLSIEAPSIPVLTAEGPPSMRAERARSTATKKSTAKKSTAKKATAKKSAAKKATAKKAGGRVVYHVTPAPDGRWRIVKEASRRASSRHDLKTDAVRRSKALARAWPLAQVVVHLADGRIQQEFTYGADPRRKAG